MQGTATLDATPAPANRSGCRARNQICAAPSAVRRPPNPPLLHVTPGGGTRPNISESHSEISTRVEYPFVLPQMHGPPRSLASAPPPAHGLSHAPPSRFGPDTRRLLREQMDATSGPSSIPFRSLLLISYQSYHMLCLPSWDDRPLSRTRIITSWPRLQDTPVRF